MLKIKAKEKRTCVWCKEVFECSPWAKNKFCSLACFNVYKTETTRRSSCLFCSRSYLRHQGNIGQKYCSVECRTKKNRNIKITFFSRCKYCDQLFIINSKHPNQETCSYSCSGKFKNLIAQDYDYMSVKTYKQYRLRISPSCERCPWNEVPEILEVHHKDRDRTNNVKSNLILLCPNCHSIDHFRAKDGQFKSNLGLKRVA